MQSVEELEQELSESEAHTEALEQALNESRVADLTELVSKTGKMRGHLTGMTPKQYEKFIGRKPPASSLIKGRDATTVKVPWDLILDQLVTERGYKSDEGLKDAIEKARNDKLELAQAKAGQRTLRNEIMDRMKAEPEVETIKIDDECPQFPKTTCKAEVTLINGMRFTLRRQHSYWRIDTARGKTIKIRYAKDARKLAKIAVKDYKQDIRVEKKLKIKRQRKGRRLTLASKPKPCYLCQRKAPMLKR